MCTQSTFTVMARLFDLADAAEISAAPFLARARAREAARLAAHAREAVSAAGVSLHLEPCVPRSPEALEAEGLAAFERAKAFAAGPRGRYLANLAVLADDHPGSCEAALGAYARGFAEPGGASVAEIGRALTALGGLDSSAGRGACLALCQILAETLGMAAA